jgi:para-nitrobenzyl esterase
MARVLGDAAFVCPTRRVARIVAAAGVPAFLYTFTHAPDVAFTPGLGAFHTVELPFVFGTNWFGLPMTAREKPLSTAMMGYWSRMAAAGDPNGGGSVAWPRYAMDSDQDLDLDLQITTGTGLRSQQCDFWDAVTPM